MAVRSKHTLDATPGRRLLVVSNRLPVSIRKDESGQLTAAPSSGGLVSALTPILSGYGGIWVGSTGFASQGEAHDAEVRKVLSSTTRGASVRYLPVFLSAEEQTNFYEGFSNEILWPLFHDLQSRCNFAPRYWEFYLRVNRRFATASLKASQTNDVIWIQDYQLMDVARQMRIKRPEGVLCFFMHIPFPAPDIFEKLPWRRTILESLLEHNLLGVQTPRDERNLVACIRTFLPGAEVEREHDYRLVTYRSRQSRIQAFPISIDFEQFAQGAASPEVGRRAFEIIRRRAAASRSIRSSYPAARASSATAGSCTRSSSSSPTSMASTVSPAGSPSTMSIAPCRARSCSPSIARPASPSSPRSRTV
jgi:trehalose 6-phosphate synthase